MDVQRNENPVALAIAQAMIEGFNKHYRIFRETSRRAKESFEAADWQGQLAAVRDRVQAVAADLGVWLTGIFANLWDVLFDPLLVLLCAAIVGQQQVARWLSARRR